MNVPRRPTHNAYNTAFRQPRNSYQNSRLQTAQQTQPRVRAVWVRREVSNPKGPNNKRVPEA